MKSLQHQYNQVETWTYNPLLSRNSHFLLNHVDSSVNVLNSHLYLAQNQIGFQSRMQYFSPSKATTGYGRLDKHIVNVLLAHAEYFTKT